MPKSQTIQIDYLMIGLFMVLAAVMLFMPDLSFAGTGGAEFAGAESRVSGIIEGTGGKLAAAVALGFALCASVLKFSPGHVASAIGVGVLASLGVAAVETGITGLI